MSVPPRTTDAAVIGILGSNYGPLSSGPLSVGQLPPVDAFIASASAVVDRVVACALKRRPCITLSAVEQELIERWLAAHYYCVMDQLYQSTSTAGASASFQGQSTMSIEGTKYGQAAINMDFSGCLSAISKRLTAGGMYIGNCWNGWEAPWLGSGPTSCPYPGLNFGGGPWY